MAVDLIDRILDERTARLARAEAEDRTSRHALDVLAFAAGRELYGLEAKHVAAVLPGRSYVPVAGEPAALRGLFGQSGRLISALDLPVLMGIAPLPNQSESARP